MSDEQPSRSSYTGQFHATVSAVARLLELTAPGTGRRLTAAAEAVPAPWPQGTSPLPSTGPGRVLALWRDLPECGHSTPAKRATDRTGRLCPCLRPLIARLIRATWWASNGDWAAADRELQRASTETRERLPQL
ncbi:hypothetical protein [Kitasatospora sp. NPDC093679]|uniref:hypothetical protein n=1 Tax=Kitasatospora sp. NPDC093679 TaxID=3154983 RepID=UPI00343581EE